MDTEDALCEAIEKSNGMDNTPKLVLADWCDENKKANFAYTLRWCVSKNRWPHFRAHIKRRPYEWTREQASYRGLSRQEVKVRSPSMLPAFLYDVMDSRDGWATTYLTWKGALNNLTVAMAMIRESIQIGDLPERIISPSDIKLVVCHCCGMARNAVLDDCPVCKMK